MDLSSASENCKRVRRGLGRRADQVVYSNEACQQRSAYKQIGLTDDTMAAVVPFSPVNHLSMSLWTPGNVLLCRKNLRPPSLSLSLSLTQSVLLALPLLLNSASNFLGHRRKSLVIICFAVSLPTQMLSLDSSLPVLKKLWIMLVSHSVQGRHMGSTNHRVCSLFIAFSTPPPQTKKTHGLSILTTTVTKSTDCTVLWQTA